ncbi:nucleotide-diphospho-sugar transferase [Mycena olivaceomarginata]|nr:nucleotide-diphospho-sugar transferase [Mycena olivaceomarginata]
MGFLSENGGQDFNMCHCESGFTRRSSSFWRYSSRLFRVLDKTGGFYYEWLALGDAPVHSMAAALFLPKSKIHFFNEIGCYEHPPNSHCPTDDTIWRAGMCSCDQGRTHDYGPYSCQHQWDRIFQ